FVSGTWYCNTPQFYREHPHPGVGDRFESCINFSDVDLGHEFPELIFDGKVKDLSDAKSLTVYSTHEPHDSWLQCFSIIGPYNGYEDSIELISKECGQDFILLPIENLQKLIDMVKIATNNEFRCQPVKYSNNPLEYGIFVKGHRYSYQNEYRFAIGKCSKGHLKEREIEVGSI